MQTSATGRMLSENALALDESIEVPAPIAEVYRRWTDFARFPEFMNNVEAVRPLGGGRYHWVARVLGTKREWDAEVTDQQENHRIAWRSLNGASNAGTVTFQPLPNNNTKVHLHLEYTPPGGAIGQRLEKLAHMTQYEVREDLKNFRRLMSGERRLDREADMPEADKVVSALAIPLAAAAIGGVVSYLTERNQRPLKARLPGKVPDPVSNEAAIASWVLTGASVASIIAAASFRARGDRTGALFLGQWAPTFLGAGILARLFGHRNVNPSKPASVASWALTGAAGGSILGAIFTYLRAHRHDGLLVGQWAPTFLGAALLTRLITRR